MKRAELDEAISIINRSARLEELRSAVFQHWRAGREGLQHPRAFSSLDLCNAVNSIVDFGPLDEVYELLAVAETVIERIQARDAARLAELGVEY